MTGRKRMTVLAASFWLALACIPGCAALRTQLGFVAHEPLPFADPPHHADLPTILIAMPPSANFVAVRRTLVSEAQKSFNLHTLAVRPESTVADLASAITSTQPVCIVLMNNATMNLYRQYLAVTPRASVVPAVLLMASFIEELQWQLPRATGIAYEVPGITAFVNLRSIVLTPVKRVGVVYRPAFRKFVERQKLLAAKENIELVATSVSNDAETSDVREALDRLAHEEKVDAVWMLNDNTLMRHADLVEEAWRYELNEANLPLVVGVPNLVNPGSPFGAMAAVPDHEALGLQAANLLFDLAENNWRAESHPVELPLSVKTVVDVKWIQAHFGLRPDALKHIDRALE
jgi:ABC-type uncharacterized transport system substrate-binding protein